MYSQAKIKREVEKKIRLLLLIIIFGVNNSRCIPTQTVRERISECTSNPAFDFSSVGTTLSLFGAEKNQIKDRIWLSAIHNFSSKRH